MMPSRDVEVGELQSGVAMNAYNMGYDVEGAGCRSARINVLHIYSITDIGDPWYAIRGNVS